MGSNERKVPLSLNILSGARAVIMDFNGVISDDEPLHLESLARVLSEEGIVLSSEDYFDRYLALDDRAAFSLALAEAGRDAPPLLISDLIRRKGGIFLDLIDGRETLFPGAAETTRALAREFPLAIASGALRREIDETLGRAGLANLFRVIISAEDVERSKPDPEAFMKALEGLRRSEERLSDLEAGEVIVIEDSIHGIDGARAAGMRVIGLAHSYPMEELRKADLVLPSIADLCNPDLMRGS